MYSSFASFKTDVHDNDLIRDHNRVVSKRALNDCEPMIELRKTHTMFEKKCMILEGAGLDSDHDTTDLRKESLSSTDDSPNPHHAIVYLDHLPPIYSPTPQQRKVLQASDRESRMTPLHLASENGHLHIVQYLCDRDVDVNAINHTGDTPLHMAVRSGNMEIVTHLLQRGADRTIRNKYQLTPEDLAVTYGRREVVSLLRAAVITHRK